MTITLGPELEAALKDLARRQGVAPETLAVNALREKLGALATPIEARDEWERLILQAGTDCGVSLSNAALSSEGLYE